MRSEGDRTIDALKELEELAAAMSEERSLADHAFWLCIDRKVIEEVNEKLDAMLGSIADERHDRSRL